MKKSPMAALLRVETRLQRVIDSDDTRISRGTKTAMEMALKDVRSLMEMERERTKVPAGTVRLDVFIDAKTGEALKGLRLRQKGRNGTPISFAETVTRAIHWSVQIMDRRELKDREKELVNH